METSLTHIYCGAAYKNISWEKFKMFSYFFFHIPDFSRALKAFIKLLYPWPYSAKNQ